MTKFNLLPYAGNISSPVITVEDTSHFKQKQVTKFNELYELNEFVFKIDMRFEPLVGEVYHVYQNDNSKNFLSMIAPHECNFLYICSIILNTDGQWVLQGGTIPKN
jgi:hypothetical protein